MQNKDYSKNFGIIYINNRKAQLYAELQPVEKPDNPLICTPKVRHLWRCISMDYRVNFLQKAK